jgi:hypothetical protein
MDITWSIDLSTIKRNGKMSTCLEYGVLAHDVAESPRSVTIFMIRQALRGKIGQRMRALMDDVDGLANSTTINNILEDAPDDVLMRGTRNPVHSATWTNDSHLDSFLFCSILNDS